MPPPTDSQLTPRMEDASIDERDGSEHSSMSVDLEEDTMTPPSTTFASMGHGGGYFGSRSNPLFKRRLGLDDDRDETGSSTTNLSNRAQAGSVAPSPPFSPMEEEPHSDSDADADANSSTQAADAQPFTAPPEIHLQPRKHALGRDGSEMPRSALGSSSGITQALGTTPLSAAALAELDREVDEEYAQEDAETRAVAEQEEDQYSSDEMQDDDADSKVKRAARRVKKEIKVVGGKIAHRE
ncbi:hypothetical protein C8F01DRAFT_1193747 [Mycena amicta]|nr:hypothetical protein C8F01DRAFT_1193747 [Mycena amicta]